MCVDVQSNSDAMLALIRKTQARGYTVAYTYECAPLRNGVYVIDEVQIGTELDKELEFIYPRTMRFAYEYMNRLLSHFAA